MKGGGLGAASDFVRQARIASIETIFQIAAKQHVDFVIVAGDVFEHNIVSDDDISSVLTIFNKYPKIPIYILPGNHDCIGPGNVFERDIFSRVEHLVVMKTADPIELQNAILHPRPVQTLVNRKNSDNDFVCVSNSPGIHVGIAHGSLMEELAPLGEIDLPIKRDCIDSSKLDYLALGHWHSVSLFPDSSKTQRIAYSGTHEQTRYEEKDAGNCLLVEIDRKGSPPKITPIRCGQLTWKTVEVSLNKKHDLANLNELLKENSKIDFLQLIISGSIDVALHDEIERTLTYYKTVFKDLRIDQSNLLYTTPFTLDSDSNFDEPLLNQIDVELRALLKKEDDAQQRSIIIESISLLNRLVRE
jgi:DNA repair exonuclease SbcCD nuclease subunit